MNRSSRSSRRRLASFALVASVAAGPFAALAAAAETSLADALPSETFVYASFDAKALDRGIRDLDLAALLRESEVSTFLNPLFESVPGVDPKDPVASLLAQSPVSEWLEGEVAFGIAGVEISFGGPDAKPMRVSPEHPVSAWLFHQITSVKDLSDGKGNGREVWVSLDGALAITPGPALREHVKQFLASPPQHLAISHESVGGRDATVLTVTGPNGIHGRAWADLSGPRWCISGSKRTLEAAMHGSRQDSLASSASYRNFKGRVAPGPTAAFVMLDLKRAAGIVESCVPPIALEEMRILGLDGVRGLGLGISFVEGGVRESALIALDGEPRGLLAPLNSLGGGFPSLDAAPDRTAFFVGLRFDPERLVSEVREAAKQLAPNASGMVDEHLGHAKIGSLDLMADVVPAFGSEVSLALAAPKTGIIPDAVFVLELRDVERFNKLLDQVKAQTGSEGVEIRPLPLANGREGFSVMVPGAPVQPAFAIVGKRLIGAVSGPGLKSYLAKSTSDADTLKSDAGLASLRRAFAGTNPESAAFWMYLDLKKSLPVVYEALTPMVPALIQESGAPLDAAQLPLAETVAAHLRSIALAVHCDGGGISIDCFSPTGMIGLGMAAAMAEQHEQQARTAQASAKPKSREVW